MARVTRELSAAWMREAILVVDGAAPSRHFWSRWMDRALAPHEGEMAIQRAPIPANDIELDGEEPLQGRTAASPQPALRYD
ncbi:hypothetical protein [Dongia deserti]|uniref:hypothetical protein n=1 Tax=Dongia deserti TaxID=2268030 RepID=UPI0013C41A68|nr:hypothetical protein [Dongia deserti]